MMAKAIAGTRTKTLNRRPSAMPTKTQMIANGGDHSFALDSVMLNGGARGRKDKFTLCLEPDVAFGVELRALG
jgi:hypothetical protein